MFSVNNDEALKNKGPTLREPIKDGAREVQENLRDTAEKAGRKVRSFILTAEDELSSATDTVKSQIRSNPVTSCALALGAGFLLGALYRR